ncbi:spliceosome associated factor 3, U4/U6 recycling protein-like [Brevipalpus obovatus]|uniref:spliceosome associated factor 3, U4/U6 recycling protein-like n=1 Tax=Brevipalpus obovatus TaxID=246614 RepID=UPI003D9F1A35
METSNPPSESDVTERTAKDWAACLRTMEREKNDPSDILQAFESSLASGFDRGSDIRELWLAYLTYLRRQTDWQNESQKDRILKTFQVANQHLSNYPDGDPDCVVPLFLATIEAKYLNNMSEARGLWENVLAIDSIACRADMWIEYAFFERQYGDDAHFREALMEALDMPLDYTDTVGEILLKYEREEGQSVESYEEAFAKVRHAINRAKKRFMKSVKKKNFEENKTKGKGKEKKEKKDPKNDTSSNSSPEGFKVPNKPGTSSSQEDIKPPDAKKIKMSVNAVKDPEIIAEMARQSKIKTGERLANELNTIVVKNLDFNLNEDKLKEVFSQFGEIIDLRLVRNFKGLSKGYAFIEFSTIEAVKKALKNDKMIIDSRPAFIDKFGEKNAHQYSTGIEKHKLFVNNLATTVTRESLQSLFEKYGKIRDIRLALKRDGTPKGVAYIEFTEEDDAAKALGLDGFILEEQPIGVAISDPSARWMKREPKVLGIGKLKVNPSLTTARTRINAPMMPRALALRK